MLDNIRIVLVNTSHPGNIGAAARAMKTMGLTQLYLVAPKQFPHPKAHEMASNAGDIVDRATVVGSLLQAIADCELVVGTSARVRTIPWPVLSPREFAEKAVQHATKGKVALLFGQEQMGLTNEELQQCNFHLQIPSNPNYSSLNIASAVQVVAYEVWVASQACEKLSPPVWDFARANADDLAGFYQHLETVLIQLKFLNPKAPRQLMARLRRLYNRVDLDVMEINILRGILGAIEKCL